MMDEGKKLATARDYAQLAALIPYLEGETFRMSAGVIVRTCQKVREGTLTPDAAIAAWHEINAIEGINRHFRSKVAAGMAETSKT